jgi:hypothetical protein
MAQKHLLTILHCVIAAVVTPMGMVGAGTIAERQPAAGLVVWIGTIVFPVLIATRVAWASGYAAGRHESGFGNHA